MNFCPNCGEKLENTPNFCPTCGSDLNLSKTNKTNFNIIHNKERVPKNTLIVFLFGMIGMLLSIVIALGILSLTDFDFFSYSLWFVVPVGGFVFGMITTSFYFGSIVKRGYMPSKKNYLLSLILLFFTFFFIQYGEYKITYVNENNQINHQFKGDHISNYMDEGGHVFNFNHYFIYQLKNSETSLMYRGREVSEVGSSTGYNIFSLIINIIGLLLGGLCSGLLSTQGKTHCVACKQAYVKEHTLGELSLAKVAQLSDMLSKAIESNNFNTFIDLIRHNDIHKNKEYGIHSETYIIKLGACPNCQNGYVLMRHYARNQNGIYNENEHKKIILPIMESFATEALKYVHVS